MSPIVHVSGTAWLLAPALGALMAAGWACFAQRALAPHDATRMLAVLAAVTTIGVIGGLFTVSIGFLTQFAAIDRTFGWCRSLAAHPVSTAAGVGALASLAYSLPAGIRAARRYRRANRFDLSDASGDTNSIVIVDSARPLAYASPGGRGHVVVSEGHICLEVAFSLLSTVIIT